MANKHGGRRPGSGPKAKGKPWLRTVSSKFAPEEITCIDKQRQPNESRAACVRRLVMGIMKNKEQIMAQEFMAMQLRPESRPGWCDETEQGYSIPAKQDEMYWVIVPSILKEARHIAYFDAKEDHPGGIVEATLTDGRWVTIKGVPWGDTEEEAWRELQELDEGDIDVWVRMPPPRRY
jgi:hypothetical protein